MKRWLILAITLTLCACSASQRQVQAPAASIVALAANDVAEILKEEYIRQGKEEIAVAMSVEDAHDRLRALERRWQPLFDAWDAFAKAHDLWRLAVEASDAAGVLSAAKAAQDAYCAVVAVAPAKLPDMPGVACAEGKAVVRDCSSGACEFR